MSDERKVIKQKNQNIMIENRKKITVTGVVDVTSFTAENVLAETDLGMLTVKGHELKINKLNLDNYEMIIEGDICACNYSEIQSQGKGGLFTRMFK